jgi:hypothetical protein
MKITLYLSLHIAQIMRYHNSQKQYETWIKISYEDIQILFEIIFNASEHLTKQRKALFIILHI